MIRRWLLSWCKVTTAFIKAFGELITVQRFGRKDHNDEEMNRDFTISPGAKIGYVSLNVSDIQKSLEFYKSILGFRQIQKNHLLIEHISQPVVHSHLILYWN
jgi:catechol-2,3-dioxygenase